MTDPADMEAGCGCIEIIEAKLAERNTRIMFPIMLGPDQTRRPMIETEQIEKGRGKKKAVGLFASHCPFCGAPYSREQAK